jgi:hypothetical protein
MHRVDGEEPEVDVLVVGMPRLLDGGKAKPSDDGRGAGAQEAGEEAERGTDPRRRIEAGGEGRRDAGEPIVIERAIDGPAVTLDDIERRAVKPPEHGMSMPPPIRPNGNPARILEKRISKKLRRRIELVTNQWSNLHRHAGSSLKMLTPRQQGDFGELSAMYWLAWRGAHVALPVGNNRHWDLVAELEGRVLRVQVKTSRFYRLGRWEIRVSTSGGNQSWNRVVKLLDPSRFDYLFVLVGDGRRWFIPAERVEAGTHLRLGGPKYAEFEVDRGDPIPRGRLAEDPSTIAS